MAGGGDAERLVVLLEGRIRDFEKNMQKASGTADRSYDRMRRGSRSATRQMEQDITRASQRINQAVASTSTQVGTLGKTFMGAFAGGVFAGGLTGLAAGIRDIVRETAAMGDEASRAGLSLRVFQEWKAVAEDTRIPLDAMVDTFKELNIRADEFATTGKGSAAEAFQRLGLTPEEVQRKLKDPSNLMLELTRRTKALNDTAAATRIFDELFGGTGAEQVVRLLQLADGEIENIISSAHESGRVLDDEMVKRAAEINKEFTTLWRNFESAAKAAILNVSYALKDGLARDMDNIATYAKDLYNDPNLKNLNRFLWGDPADKRINGAFKTAREGSGSTELAGALQQRFGEQPPSPSVKPPPPGSRGSRTSAVDEALKEQEAVNKLIESLTHELELVGKSDLEQAKLNARRQAGAAAREGQLTRIDMLVESIYREAEANKLAEQAAEARKQSLDNLFQMASGGLLSVLDGSEKAEDAVKKLAVQLAFAAAQGALLGTGPLAGLFGGGVGGLLGFTAKPFGFASGTANTGGQRGQPRGIVHGQEAVIPLPNGGKVPVAIQGGGGVGSGQTRVKVDVGVSVDKNGNLQAFVRDVAQEATSAGISTYDKGRSARFINDFKDMSRRSAVR